MTANQLGHRSVAREPDRTARPNALLLTSNYPPEIGPAPRRGKLLAEALVAAGFNVTVATWQPNHPQRRVRSGHEKWLSSEDVSDGIAVRRVRPILGPSSRLLARGLAEAFSCALMGAVSVVAFKKWHLVVATSPSMFLGPLGSWLARLYGAPFVWDVRDLTWEYAENVSGTGFVLRALRRMMMGAARRAAMLITTTQGQSEYFTTRGSSRDRVACVPNPLDPRWIARTRDLARASAGRSHNGALTVLYAGLLGLPQRLDVLIQAAEVLAAEPMTFVLAGDGPDAQRLRRLAQERRLQNVSFTGYLDQDSLLNAFAKADVCYAQLRDGTGFQTAFPTKLLEYMAAGRPIIYGGGGDTVELLQRIGCALVVEPDSVPGLVGALRMLSGSPDLRVQLGRNGREFAETECAYDNARNALSGLFDGSLRQSEYLES